MKIDDIAAATYEAMLYEPRFVNIAKRLLD